MKKIIATLILAAMLIALTACGGADDQPENTETSDVPVTFESVAGTTDDGTDSETEPEEKVIKISTPYCDLSVPAAFEGNVVWELSSEEPYTLDFKAADGTALFSLIFGERSDVLLGTLKLEDKNVVIYASFADFDSNNENLKKYAGYQEDINTVIKYLSEDYDFVINEIVEDESTFDIETRVTTLKYPKKWFDKVTITGYEDRVTFAYKNEMLFDLSFVDGNEGFLLGTYSGIPIYIIDYEIKEDNYTEDEVFDMYCMQEDVNVILQYLMEDPNFIINK